MNWDTALQRINTMRAGCYFTGSIVERAALDTHEVFGEVRPKWDTLHRAGEIIGEIVADNPEKVQDWVETIYGAEVVAALIQVDPSGHRVPDGLEVILSKNIAHLIEQLYYGQEEN